MTQYTITTLLGKIAYSKDIVKFQINRRSWLVFAKKYFLRGGGLIIGGNTYCVSKLVG